MSCAEQVRAAKLAFAFPSQLSGRLSQSPPHQGPYQIKYRSLTHIPQPNILLQPHRPATVFSSSLLLNPEDTRDFSCLCPYPRLHAFLPLSPYDLSTCAPQPTRATPMVSTDKQTAPTATPMEPVVL